MDLFRRSPRGRVQSNYTLESAPRSRSRGLALLQSLCASSNARVAALLMLLALVTFRALYRYSTVNFQSQHLGWECFNVARALIDGRGFSDPFSEPTGPTAWVSPAYTLVLATLLFILREKQLVAIAVVALTCVVLAFVGTSLFNLAARYKKRISPTWMVALFIVWVGAFHYWFFILTSDVWLLLLVAQLMLTNLARYSYEGQMRSATWGALGGVGALTSPALGTTWMALIGYYLLRDRAHRRRWMAAVAIAAVIAAPWTLRNAIVFHQFIPTKSNAGYEAYQANLVDEDGIYDRESFHAHPAQLEDARFDYARLGETEFVARHSMRFKNFVREHPGQYALKVLRRTIAATLHDNPMWPSQNTPLERLEHTVKTVYFPIPLVGLVVLLTSRGPHRPTAAALAAFYGVYLLPYVAIAFYVRFLLPLTPILMLALFLGLDHVAMRRALSHSRSQDALGSSPNPLLTQESV